MGPVVAGVESVEPPPGPVGGGATAHPVSLGPGQGSVVAVLGGELEGLHLVVTEELHLVIPVRHRPLPVSGGQPDRLFEDEEVLTNSKPSHPPALSAVVSELALVSVGLGYLRQL